MSRRFLYMAVENLCASPVSHTLHRINPSRLFYPKEANTRAKTEVAAADAVKARLPPPSMTFSSPDVDNVVETDFALIGRSKDKIVALHRAHFDDTKYYRVTTQGSAVLYDDAPHSFRALPDITATLPHGEVAPVAVGDDLYFIHSTRFAPNDKDRYVHAFIRDPAGDGGWHWHSFPPPPVEGGAAGAYAVVDRSHIWASTRGHGTYSMDTATGVWSKASDSPLPFMGRAEYAPELGLWFGWDRGLLCAWDLKSAGAGAAPMELWEGFTLPRGSYVRSQYLVHLGDGGRFCVAKLFEMIKPPPTSCCARCYYDNCPPKIGFAVLTGMEVERCDSGELRMIKHRSRKYSLGETRISHAVL
ncbi:hypothetical protein CFC21_082534 [Triticum aestivum]|uniref:DUF1618 domain-containing protein n=2 Tax=Triticum aestivum TaxID=4565 RepID=A0A9R1L572_WHEAT|nr:hypothetical protein CFC21_082534 [Triticum aestivum]